MHVCGGRLADVGLGLETVVTARHVVQAHRHERRRVDVAEARTEHRPRRVGTEQLGACAVAARIRFRCNDDGSVDGSAARADRPALGGHFRLRGDRPVGVGEVVGRLVVVGAEQTGSLAVVPAECRQANDRMSAAVCLMAH